MTAIGVKENIEICDLFAGHQNVINSYYESREVQPNTTREKILAMHAVLGERHFSAYGGGETDEMELRALEYIFLVEKNLI